MSTWEGSRDPDVQADPLGYRDAGHVQAEDKGFPSHPFDADIDIPGQPLLRVAVELDVGHCRQAVNELVSEDDQFFISLLLFGHSQSSTAGGQPHNSGDVLGARPKLTLLRPAKGDVTEPDTFADIKRPYSLGPVYLMSGQGRRSTPQFPDVHGIAPIVCTASV